MPAPPPLYGADPRYPPGRRPIHGVLTAVAILMATAALVVAVISLVTKHEPDAAPGKPSTSVSPTSSAATNTEAADRALCEAISPLMKESIDIGKSFVNLGHSGTPERDAGVPGFQAAVENWAGRIQPVADAHADPPRFLTRTLQRYIDDFRLYAANFRPGPATDADNAAWNDGTVALGGPMAVCGQLGVRWW
ncbi:hypothetical protein BST20_27825 [Mycobacterium branderi]|nr:hypothetical protein BST20_27825 [Mycobacterium branderi]